MMKNIVTKFSIVLALAMSHLVAQDADPIEAARQAKLAAEKAAADAEAATGAAIEAAAAKAAAEAREKVIADREAEKARKIAEQEAAENAEMDAAAEAAALEARRKLAAELGLEVEEVPDSSINEELTMMDSSIVDDSLKTSPLAGFKIGIAPSLGYLSGATFTSIPIGATAVITTPFGFKVGPFDYTVSLTIGGYAGKYESKEDDEFVLGEGEVHSVNEFNPMVFGLGGNLTLIDLVFAEGHIGIVGEGFGIRGFTGVSLEYLMKKSLNLPFNVLVGGELFYSSDMAGAGNSSGWLSIAARLDYSF